ncbi:MAG: LysM peptidoglycan-binding domain-containing protein [Chloroflexi bacterium]|nr:LysM peptidoglycan-binding domain-containing protein [Chloroflexota bacterium]
MRNGLILALLLLLALTGCSSAAAGEAPEPAAAPVRAADDAETAAGSPRVTPGPADSGVPPTWTPLPPPPTQPPFSPSGSAFRPAPGEAASHGEVYEVVEGDTLAEIAIRFDVELDTLAAANGIDDWDQIEVGQKLVIPR